MSLVSVRLGILGHRLCQIGCCLHQFLGGDRQSIELLFAIIDLLRERIMLLGQNPDIFSDASNRISNAAQLFVDLLCHLSHPCNLVYKDT